VKLLHFHITTLPLSRRLWVNTGHWHLTRAYITERRRAMDVAMTALASEGVLWGFGHVCGEKFLIRLLGHGYLVLG